MHRRPNSPAKILISHTLGEGSLASLKLVFLNLGYPFLVALNSYKYFTRNTDSMLLRISCMVSSFGTQAFLH